MGKSNWLRRLFARRSPSVRHPLSDADYREKLIAEGHVRAAIVATAAGAELDRIGNIVGVYRTTMAEQDPSRFAIENFAKSLR